MKRTIIMYQTEKRDWGLYNMAQTSEKLLFMRILNDAVASMNIHYTYNGNGRPSIGIEDMLKVCVIKVFNGFSQRRTVPDLHMAKALGYIMEVPHFNSIGNYFNDPKLTPYLEELYKIMATPFIPVEEYFAVDATGFSKYNTTWLGSKYQRVYKSFNKLHIVVGVRTTVITSARITPANVHDTTKFAELLKESCKYFTVREITADKGYLSIYNVNQAAALGVVPYIKPKKDSKEYSIYRKVDAAHWNRMIIIWKLYENKFKKHYHRRSNVESAFSSMKRKFLPYIRSKKPVSQKNEILAKVCCHNASMLVVAIFELDLQAEFKKKR